MSENQTREGQTAIITGAARGIGAAVARKLHSEGAHVRLFDLDPSAEALADELGERADHFILDVTDPDAWTPALAGRRTDVLVTCAGILGPQGPITEVDLAEWQQVIDVNLTGTFVASRAVLPAMIEQDSGYLVYLASIGGKEGNAGQAAYCASKGGVITLAKSVSKEVADHGILVNCVSPTMVAGPLVEAMEPWRREEILAKIPLGRVAQPTEVAELVAWACSAGCTFTTGACFDLTGGRATW